MGYHSLIKMRVCVFIPASQVKVFSQRDLNVRGTLTGPR